MSHQNIVFFQKKRNKKLNRFNNYRNLLEANCHNSSSIKLKKIIIIIHFRVLKKSG